ncbi:MAG: type II toxin-antitoxin system HicA family toxin [Oscillospiraceae bacterium]
MVCNGETERSFKKLMSKQYSVRELRKLLEANGYRCKRTTGSHSIFSNGNKIVVLPVVTLNYKVANKIVSQIAK